MKIKAALTASLGGAMEWYDFIIYGFFVQIFVQQFFPLTDAYYQSILSFSIFAVGFAARPIGALFFGHIGDKHGRSDSLYDSMLLIGAVSLSFAIIPTYSLIGIWASILFIILRILQGFAIGGSISGSIIYLAELSEPHNRSFWVSTTFIGIMRGVILASGISAVLFTYLTPYQLHEWGWRIAFLFGGSTILFAHYAHGVLVETPHHSELRFKNQVHASPLKLLFQEHKLTLIKAIGLTGVHAIPTIFIFVYLPTFLKHYGMGTREASSICLATVMVFSSILPFFGWLANKIDLRRMLIIGSITMICSIHFILHMMISPHFIIRTIGILCLTSIESIITASLPPLMVGLFPTSVRYSGVSFAYNTGIALFGGLSMVIISILGHLLGSLVSGSSIMIIFGAAMTIVTCLFIKKECDFIHKKDLKGWKCKD